MSTHETTTPTTTGARPVGVIHLIFGLIFCGIAALWLIGNAQDADFPDLAKGVPAVLIGAGLVGLGASAVNHRRARARLLARETAVDATTDPAVDPAADPASGTPEQTMVIENDKDES